MVLERVIRWDQLRDVGSGRRHWRFRVLREWCFVRAAGRHLGPRVAFIAAVLIGGGLLFRQYDSHRDLSFAEAAYYTWSLVFGQAPERFPKETPLRVMFFLVPVLGLTVIIEGIVDFALLLRDRRRYERNWCMMMARSMSGHVVLVGFGRLGYRVFQLLRRLGEYVVVIERDANNRFLEELRRDGSPLILGDARDDVVLQQANVEAAKSVVLATDDDLANLEIALDSRRICPGIRVVLRMFDQNLADKVRDGFNIHIAMSQSMMAAPAFATAAINPSIVYSFGVGDQLVVIQRCTVRQGGPFAGKSVGQVMSEMGCGVVEVRASGQAARLFPAPDTVLNASDELLVQGPFGTLAEVAGPE